MSYKPTSAQEKAWALIGGDAKHVLLAGGSRSGKTFIICRAMAMRALAAPNSRHAILRFRFNAVKLSVALDTWPKMMRLCFPNVSWTLDKTLWVATLGDGSQVWFGGLDDKERTEKILGQEYATIFLNECSQIPLSSVNIASTRLAQVCEAVIDGQSRPLRLKLLYDENPPNQGHWSYKKFVRHIEPESGQVLSDPSQYAMMYMNPLDNVANLTPDYLAELQALPVRMRRRFFEGKFAEVAPNALWDVERIEKARRIEDLPDMLRVIVGIDPSGAGDTDNESNDEIGIVVAGLGMDGRGYILEDVSCRAGPKVWGEVATTAYDRQAADLIVGEKNFGGAMVKFVVRAAKPSVPYKEVVASRGKAVRAEPISSLTEQGRVCFAGYFPELEDELCNMTTTGFRGEGSPNRADAAIWALSELFPEVTRSEKKKPEPKPRVPMLAAVGDGAWMT